MQFPSARDTLRRVPCSPLHLIIRHCRRGSYALLRVARARWRRLQQVSKLFIRPVCFLLDGPYGGGRSAGDLVDAEAVHLEHDENLTLAFRQRCDKVVEAWQLILSLLLVGDVR